MTVAWAVDAGPATVAAPTSVTNAQGIATVTASGTGTAGGVTVSATVAGLPVPTLFGPLSVVNAARLVRFGPGVVFTSARNGSSNPAVDTVAVGQGVPFSSAGGTHSIQSTGTPSFVDSPDLATGETYSLGFGAAGTYAYECGVHGAAMNGRILVQ